jgi:hypothetical protein
LLVLAGLGAAVGTAGAVQPSGATQADAVRSAMRKGVAFLKAKQRDGDWEPAAGPAARVVPGGVSSLVLLALAESGVKPDEAALADGLKRLRQLKPEQTYVISLQTRLFCKVDPKKYAEQIQRNVELLLLGMQREPGRLLGWSYQAGIGGASGRMADNSNTHYAVLALHAASQAGARVPEQTWKELRAYYLNTQNADGGWGYHTGDNASRATMTAAGLCGLLITARELRLEGRESLVPVTKAVDSLTSRFDLSRQVNLFDLLVSLAEARRLAGKDLPAERQQALRTWAQQGVDLLLKEQAEDGSWGKDKSGPHVLISTSFGLMFLADARERP